MRLSTLNPKLRWSPTGNGYTHQLEFDCPKCGPPHRILVCCSATVAPGAVPGVWKLSYPETPSGDGWDGVTLEPSIGNRDHGKNKQCGYHCSIISGEVLP